MTIGQVIERNMERLRDGFPYFVQDETFEQWLNDVDASIQRGEVDNNGLAHWWGSFLFGNEEGSNDVPYVHSAIFTVMAKHANVDGNCDQAWPLISHASYCMGMAESISVQKGSDADVRRENAVKGGFAKAKSRGYNEFKAEIVRSLQSPPDEGWKNMKTTALSLEKKFDASFKNSWAHNLPEDIFEVVLGWLYRDATIRSAFKANQATTG